jgi:hypothetical protein
MFTQLTIEEETPSMCQEKSNKTKQKTLPIPQVRD